MNYLPGFLSICVRANHRFAASWASTTPFFPGNVMFHYTTHLDKHETSVNKEAQFDLILEWVFNWRNEKKKK